MAMKRVLAAVLLMGSLLVVAGRAQADDDHHHSRSRSRSRSGFGISFSFGNGPSSFSGAYGRGSLGGFGRPIYGSPVYGVPVYSYPVYHPGFYSVPV
ncbi:MAG: hypothetical protein ACK5A1_14165 [Planctomyces sp.]